MKNVTPEIQKKNEFKNQAMMTLLAVGSLLALILAVLWPLGTIWALNALFKLGIEYTFTNWFACVVLILTTKGALGISKKTIDITKHGK
jgi:hypothetical protein